MGIGEAVGNEPVDGVGRDLEIWLSTCAGVKVDLDALAGLLHRTETTVLVRAWTLVADVLRLLWHIPSVAHGEGAKTGRRLARDFRRRNTALQLSPRHERILDHIVGQRRIERLILRGYLTNGDECALAARTSVVEHHPKLHDEVASWSECFTELDDLALFDAV